MTTRTLIFVFSMPEFSIKNYQNHQEDVKRVCLKYYEWALDRQLKR